MCYHTVDEDANMYAVQGGVVEVPMWDMRRGAGRRLVWRVVRDDGVVEEASVVLDYLDLNLDLLRWNASKDVRGDGGASGRVPDLESLKARVGVASAPQTGCGVEGSGGSRCAEGTECVVLRW